MKTRYSLAISAMLCSVVAASAHGQNLLRNGGFEAPDAYGAIDVCDWEGSTTDGNVDGQLPRVLAYGGYGDSCAYLDLDTTFPYTYTNAAWQEVDVTAAVDQWVVLEFRAQASGRYDEPNAYLTVTGSGSAGGLVPLTGVWTPYTLAVQVSTANPTVRVAFAICDQDTGSHLLIDNVHLSVTSDTPTADSLDTPPTCMSPPSIVGYIERVGDPCCAGDITGADGFPDGVVDVLDLGIVLGEWGTLDCSWGDITGATPGVPDGEVDVLDLNYITANWGSCS